MVDPLGLQISSSVRFLALRARLLELLAPWAEGNDRLLMHFVPILSAGGIPKNRESALVMSSGAYVRFWQNDRQN